MESFPRLMDVLSESHETDRQDYRVLNVRHRFNKSLIVNRIRMLIF